MAKNKRVSLKDKITKEDIRSAEKGDFCYYLNNSNKIGFAEIQSVFTENDLLVLQIICQQEFKFRSLPYYFCSFNENDLKGKKRNVLSEAHLNV